MSKAQAKTRTTSSAKMARQALTTTSEAAGMNVSPEQRRQMIAEAAYYRAQQRGFQLGDPQEDWLAAEAEIDHMLVSTRH